MTTIKLIFVVVMSQLLLIVNYSQTKDEFSDFTRLTSKGDVPDDILLRTSAKVAKDITTEVSSSDNSKVRKSKEQFLLKSNYMIDELLSSGRILFGDEVSNYVEKVAGQLIKNQPDLQSELRFYTLKSNITNAFTTNQGMIFVTTGLISQLENEAQLAFVLAHEITHYTKKHVINSYLEADKIYSQRNRYKYNNYDSDIIKLSNYSKSLEFESDSAGFYILEKAGYDIEEAYSIFDVLQFSYLPYEEMDFDESMFETQYLKIPENLKLDTLVEIDFEVETADEKSTHPNIDKRRKKIKEFIKFSESNSSNKHLVSEDEFLNVRELCRFEAIRLNLKNQQYVKAIYNSQVLLNKHPQNNFLEKSILKALYGIYVYKSYSKYYKIIDSYDNYQGSQSAAYYLFENMDSKLVGSIFLSKAWGFYNKSSDDHIKKLIDDVVYKLIDRSDVKYSDYKTIEDIKAVKEKVYQDSLLAVQKEQEVINNAKQEDSIPSEPDEESLSKYEKIRLMKQEKEGAEEIEAVTSRSEENAFTLALAGTQNQNKLQNLFIEKEKEFIVNKEKEAKESEYWNSLSYKKRRRISNKNYQGLINDSAKVNKVMFVDPEFFLVDERKGVKLVNSEEKKYEFIEQIDYVSEKSQLQSEFLSGKLMEKQNVYKYNQLASYNDWFGEILAHEDIDEDMKIIPSEGEYVAKIADEENIDYLVYSGILSYKNEKKNKAVTLIVTMIYFPLLPAGLIYVLTPSYDTYFYTRVLNPKTSTTVSGDVIVLDGKANEGEINSHVYEMMYHIKN